jgi:septum formation protein
VPDIDEKNNDQLKPYELATHLAEKKAESIIGRAKVGDIILGCDTIVILDNKILGKPSSKIEAQQMLSLLAGRKHTVCSAIALRTVSGEPVSGHELTDVYFKNVSPIEIEKYVDTGEPLDKAGAYGIQDTGVFLVDRFVGNIDNIIGLPMTLLDKLAGKLGEK